LYGGSNITLVNIIGGTNAAYFYNDDTTIDLITVINATSNSIYLNGADRNNISNIFVSGNLADTGIYATTSDNNTISYMVADGLQYDAVSMTSSTGNIIYNLTATNNPRYGVAFGTACLNNELYNSTLIGNDVGLRIESSAASNMFYNNHIANTINIQYTATGNNYFNTSNQTGPNIVNGTNIGGNYWSNYTGTDGNGDGFGDTPYQIDGTNFDYLPLVFPNTPPTTPTPTLVSVDGLNNTDSDLNCSAVLFDVDGDSLNVTAVWYLNGTISQTDYYNNSYDNNFNFSAILDSSNTDIADIWSCSIRLDDAQAFSDWGNSSNLTILNSIPTVPTLISPTDGNMTIHERYTSFNWTTSVDGDGDDIYYEINATNGLCGNFFITDINDSNYTSESELCLDDYQDGTYNYFWKVRACDSETCSDWSDTWNFSIEPWVVITIVNNTINFGAGYVPGDENDTSNNDPAPFYIRNDGNVKSDLVNISAADPLWVMQTLGTEYTKIKARNATELNSFNWTTSITDWVNLTSTNTSIIKDFDYSDSNDDAYIDMYIRVPSGEPPGHKNISVVFTWEQTP